MRKEQAGRAKGRELHHPRLPDKPVHAKKCGAQRAGRQSTGARAHHPRLPDKKRCSIRKRNSLVRPTSHGRHQRDKSEKSESDELTESFNSMAIRPRVQSFQNRRTRKSVHATITNAQNQRPEPTPRTNANHCYVMPMARRSRFKTRRSPENAKTHQNLQRISRGAPHRNQVQEQECAHSPIAAVVLSGNGPDSLSSNPGKVQGINIQSKAISDSKAFPDVTARHPFSFVDVFRFVLSHSFARSLPLSFRNKIHKQMYTRPPRCRRPLARLRIVHSHCSTARSSRATCRFPWGWA